MASSNNEHSYSFEHTHTSTGISFFGPGMGNLIPVELPERTHGPIGHGNELERSSLDLWPAGSGVNTSPGSDASEDSVQSVQITGDIFSAPTRLKGIMDKLTNVKDAGDCYSWHYPLTSLPSSPSSSRRSSGADPLRVSSAAASPRPRLLPTPPPFQPLECVREYEGDGLSWSDASPFSPTNRPQLSPKGPRPQNKQPAQSTRTQRRSKYRLRESHGPGSKLAVHLDLTTLRRQSAPSTSNLNPHAPAFTPSSLPRPRAHSVPVDSETHRTGFNTSCPLPSDEHRPPEPAAPLEPLYSHLSLTGDVSRRSLASIRHDLPHLREWSNQFGPLPFPRLDLGPPSMLTIPYPQNYMHTTQVSMAERPAYPPEAYPTYYPPISYPLFTPNYLPVVPMLYTEQQLTAMGSRAFWNVGYGQIPPNTHPGFPPSMGTEPKAVNGPFIELTPVELPESTVMYSSHDASYPPTDNRTSAASQEPSPEALLPVDAASPLRRRSSPALFERGKSSLTPITERSEATSASTSQRTDVTDDQEELETDEGSSKRKNRRNKKPSWNVRIRRKTREPKGTN